ncbi:ATP-binding protein [Flavobacterium facile]|uniref:ATP-binding protein n=1 Tax=Flavobacterium facile TaxID=2893174 RepID=UPI002E78A114|nr:DUF87 domain-containing protein [Flavobacterium sp. T-12]
MKKIIFYLSNRFILAIAFTLLFFIIHYFYTSSVLPSTNTKDTWFYSGLLLLLFSIIFVEPFYTSPKNIITNTIPLLISYIAIKNDFKDSSVWYYTFWFVFLCFLLALISLALHDTNESSESTKNKIAEKIRTIVSIIATGKIIYSLVFISIIFLYKYDLDKEFGVNYFFVMIILWGLILIINPKSLHSKLTMEFTKKDINQIGSIFSIQSNNMYLVKLFEDKNDIQKFDLVKFKESSQNKNNLINQGFVFDTYKLNSEKWAKILCLDSSIENKKYEKNIVYKLSSNDLKLHNETIDINNFVGVIVEGSKIGNIKFEYSKKNNNIQEGDLIELQSQEKKIFYQIVGGFTEYEKLENKNESGFIIGDAIQLGIWNEINSSFEKFGWIPEINTPIFLAETKDYQVEEITYPEFKLGNIPNTSLPSIINLEEAVSHHTALLGITGSGKSFLAREIINSLNDSGTNVICIDFTGEWKRSMDLQSLNRKNLDDFLKPENKQIGLVELPTMSNTVAVIESTESFISTIFNKAKEAYEAGNPMKICLVLEEAHTIIPEANFLGVNDFNSKAVVNKMGQVALQGRKYGVGLFVIAQRTANVSKTVLTQCNTIICFQAFDETSFTFLGNYIGKDLVQALPNLKKYHAIVTGKAIKSNIPMIVDLERK